MSDHNARDRTMREIAHGERSLSRGLSSMQRGLSRRLPRWGSIARRATEADRHSRASVDRFSSAARNLKLEAAFVRELIPLRLHAESAPLSNFLATSGAQEQSACQALARF